MENDDPYIEEDLFPRALEGRRMCPRCMDCEVKVGRYKPPISWPTPPGTAAFASTSRLTLPGLEFFWGKVRVLPSLVSLRPEPSGDPSGEPEAWYCIGGCNEKGEHSRRPVPPSFIGRVRKAR